jgi:hypothetical protein
MIDSSNAFCNKGLGAVSPPPQYCSFPVTVSADSSNRPFSAKKQQKNQKNNSISAAFSDAFQGSVVCGVVPGVVPDVEHCPFRFFSQ